ncbi:MAG: hypothetical protein BM555_00105 [Crocinitomix sp. MedPE-SWsnd]|nr:MAG: hypothetical protein BM555_00105 [Crocinitomix sp. MedPE-SWsnd]
MRKAIEFIVYSNIWISAGAAGFGTLYYFLNEKELNKELIAFLFCSTLLTYTFQRFEKLRKKERISGPRMEWMIANSVLVYILMGLTFVGTIYFALYFSFESISLLFCLGPISFLYAFKLKFRGTPTNLRDIPFIKIVLIGVVWAISCYLIPFIEDGQSNYDFLIPSIAFFTYIIGITIPFDIRDMEVDEKSKKTIPQIFGESFSRFIAALLIAISACLLIYQFEEQWIEIAVTHTISITVVMGASAKRDELFFSFLVDGLLVLFPLTFYLLKSL